MNYSVYFTRIVPVTGVPDEQILQIYTARLIGVVVLDLFHLKLL